ncbi:leucine-rich repeat protein [Parabacteroides goldsteinii]|nr:leucine-rich repeat protein [Parabacteroides goldsteinii]
MKHFILILTAAMSSLITAHAERITLHCETAGSLQDTLELKGLTDLKEIHSLKISGHLHAGDFRLFKQMALDSLDLSTVEIDAFYGIGTYAPGMFGYNNQRQYNEAEIPINAFSFRSNYNNSLSGMESLVYIQLPTTLKSIGNEAFAMTPLSAIELPQGLETIETDAFLGCPQLEEIEIPASVSRIGETRNDVTYGVFACCESLRNIHVAEGNEYYTSIGGVLFNKNQTKLLQYPAGKEEAEYQIPDGIGKITHRAFEYSQSLRKVTIPASVDTIERAFWDCNKLEEVVCKRETPAKWRALGATQWVEPFDYRLLTEGVLTVPAECKDRYANNWDWGQFRHIQEEQSATSFNPIETAKIHIHTNGQQIYIRQTGNDILDIKLYDMTGKLIHNHRGIATERQFQVDGKGLYIININETTYKCICK